MKSCSATAEKYTRHSNHCAPGFAKLLNYAYSIFITNAMDNILSAIKFTLGCAVISLEDLAVVNPLDVRYSAQRHNNIKEE